MKGRMLIACVLAAILCLPSAGTGREKPYLAAFGDSITTGFTLPGGRYDCASWLNLTAETLGLGEDDYVNFAENGARAADVLAQIRAHTDEVRRARILVFDVGYNDILGTLYDTMANALGEYAAARLPETWEALTEQEKETLCSRLTAAAQTETFRAILAAFRDGVKEILGALREANPDARIYMQSIYNPFAAWDALRAYSDAVVGSVNRILCEEAEEAGCRFLDVFAAFRDHEKLYTNMEHYDIHPSEAGHAAIGALFLDALRADGYLADRDGSNDDASLTESSSAAPIETRQPDTQENASTAPGGQLLLLAAVGAAAAAAAVLYRRRRRP